MKPTVNYFLQSIKDGNTGNFVNAIENMTAEQVESLTKCFETEMNTQDEELSFCGEGGWQFMERNGFNTLKKAFYWWGNSVTQWAFENLRYDHRTVTNQDIIRKLVQREVYCCQSSLVSCLPWEDFERENGMYYRVQLSDGEEEFSEDEKEERLNELREKLEKHEENEPDDLEVNKPEEVNKFDEEYEAWEEQKETLENDIEALENAESEFCDIYEHWVVSGWLEGELRDKGECIVEFTETGDTWWGRCTTGQAISLDWVMCQIAYDMGILEFQANSWAK